MKFIYHNFFPLNHPSALTTAPQILGGRQSAVQYVGAREVADAVWLAVQTVGIQEVEDRIWLVSFLDYDLGFFDEDVGRVEPATNPFVPEL